MPSFQPRTFPPPALQGVPVEYIADQLHSLAPGFWDKQETADCTIIIPFPHAQGKPELPGFSAISTLEPAFSFGTSYENTMPGRRYTQPPLNAVPRISLPLHTDFLAAHSSYLRGLFSGALPLDLMFSSTPPSSTSGIPADRLPRLMPCSPDHPILFLPVPDPSSVHLLLHWMYFGDFTVIQECLHSGTVQWDGIARNAEYLGLSAEMKLFLMDWYNAWLNPDRECISDADTVYDEDEDSDDDEDGYSTASDLDEYHDADDEKAAVRAHILSRPASLQDLRSPSV
ncbi:hypothetical protein D9619_005474 [Psilocybe cf. subviscida]|uniref:BTB domain-containing protein n=1 Tax=Psilocybe cf. subviscida TaxID=2480587 RepID=A0A8H5FBJ7_9AGAR|nr:hypothetical protein D9619_005474 [Psilocybe cf. subviscida]